MKHTHWLEQELPKWIKGGMITEDISERILKHYDGSEESASKNWAIILFGILGSFLLLSGIILLLANNWKELSRPIRAIISITPLVVSILLGIWILWKKKTSTAWRESVGTAQCLSIGVAISLISQTYNIGGRFDQFILIWCLLALPISYLLRATLPALLYLAGITVWVGSASYQESSGWGYALLVILALPFLWLEGRAGLAKPRAVLFRWVLAITISIGMAHALREICRELDLWPVVYGSLFSVLFLLGSYFYKDVSSPWRRPFFIVGALGSVGLALILSFQDVWSRTENWSQIFSNKTWETAFPAFELALLGGLLCLALFLFIRFLLRHKWLEAAVGSLYIVALLAWFFAGEDKEIISAIIFNAYLFMNGLGLLLAGIRKEKLGILNAGMAILAILILCRFFDSDFSLAARGMAFVLIGIGFLLTNIIITRKKGKAAS